MAAKNVGGLHVTMDHSFPVQILQPRQHLSEELPQLVLGEVFLIFFMLLYDVLEVFALREALEDEVDVLLAVVDI